MPRSWLPTQRTTVHRSASRAKHDRHATVDTSGEANLVHTSSTHSAWSDAELFEAISAEPEDFDTREVQRLLEVAKERGVGEVLLSPARTALAAHLWFFSTVASDLHCVVLIFPNARRPRKRHNTPHDLLVCNRNVNAN